jgi:hypothetical protein
MEHVFENHLLWENPKLPVIIDVVKQPDVVKQSDEMRSKTV